MEVVDDDDALVLAPERLDKRSNESRLDGSTVAGDVWRCGYLIDWLN